MTHKLQSWKWTKHDLSYLNCAVVNKGFSVSIPLLTLYLFDCTHETSAVHITLEQKHTKLNKLGLFLMVAVCCCTVLSNLVISCSMVVAYVKDHDYCQDYRLVCNTQTTSCSLDRSQFAWLSKDGRMNKNTCNNYILWTLFMKGNAGHHHEHRMEYYVDL